MKLDLEQDVKGMLPEKDFDRRDFIWTALGASAALARVVAGVGAADHHRHQRTRRRRRDDPGQGWRSIRGYRAMPATGGPFPVVLVGAEIFGLNPYMKDVCRRLAKAGYYAIVPDLYTRKADLTKITDMAEIMPIVNTQVRHRARRRLRRDGRVRGGERQGRHRADGDHRLLPRRAHDACLRGGQSEAQGGGRVVRPGRRHSRTSTRRARRWIASPRSRSRCSASTAPRTRASRSTRSRSSSPR